MLFPPRIIIIKILPFQFLHFKEMADSFINVLHNDTVFFYFYQVFVNGFYFGNK